MSTIAFPQAGNGHTLAPSPHPVRSFLVDWYQATPAGILLRPVGSFLGAWFQATPVSMVLRMLSR